MMAVLQFAFERPDDHQALTSLVVAQFAIRQRGSVAHEWLADAADALTPTWANIPDCQGYLYKQWLGSPALPALTEAL